MWNQLQQLPHLWFLIDLMFWGFSALLLIGALIGWWIRVVDMNAQLTVIADPKNR